MTPGHMKRLEADLRAVQMTRDAAVMDSDLETALTAIRVAERSIQSVLSDAKRYPDATCRCRRETEPADERAPWPTELGS